MQRIKVDHWYTNDQAVRFRSESSASTQRFHESLDGYVPTALVELPKLATQLGVGRVYVKDESNRLGLPAFKILGASWAVSRALCQHLALDPSEISIEQLRQALQDSGERPPALVTATDGNHGRAVARMAKTLGLSARVYIPGGLDPAAIFALAEEGAEVVQTGLVYDRVVEAAAASTTGSATDLLIQDTAWAGYEQVPQWIVDGYSTLFSEIDQSLEHDEVGVADLVVCPVGVGSLAQAMVDHYRAEQNPHPALMSVEPDTAACIAQSLSVGKPVSVDTSFPTIMTGLNCGTPSPLGWPSLKAGLSAAISVSDDQCRTAMADLAELGVDAGPCGAATLAGLRAALADAGRREALGLGSESTIVLVSTEGSAANPAK